jgi:hypothetical protein
MSLFLDALESRTHYSAAPASVAPLGRELVEFPRSQTSSRQLLSVLTFHNDTDDALTFKLRWTNEPATKYTLKPNRFRILSIPEQALAAAVKFDARPGPAMRMTRITALSKPFVANDPAGLLPRNPTDGATYTFSTNTAQTKLTLKADLDLDRNKFAGYRAAVRNDFVPGDRSKIAYPDLGSRFEVLSPSTGRPNQSNDFDYTGFYNCIAWTLGEVNRWVDPLTGPANNPLARMDKIYAKEGYRRLKSLDFDAEKGKQKVVVYALRDDAGSNTKVTHAALQNLDGSWSSKLGALALIRHWQPHDIAGPLYGTPVAVYARHV